MYRKQARKTVEWEGESDPFERASGTRRVAPRYSERPTAPPPPEFSPLTIDGNPGVEPRPSSRPTRPAPRNFETVEYRGSTGFEQAAQADFLPSGRPAPFEAVGALAQHLGELGAGQGSPEIRVVAEPAADLSRLGSLERVAYVRWSHAQLLSAKMDHKDGFILSLVDGHSSIETILDLSNMPREKALAALQGLWSRGIIAFL